MYQLLVEKLLGLKLDVDRLTVAPLFPADWSEYKIHYRYRQTLYHVHVVKTPATPPGLRRLLVDDAEQADLYVHLVDDGRDHFVRAEIGVGANAATA